MIRNVLKYLAVALFVGLANGQVITVTNGETDGRWGPLETCPAGSRAVSYQTTNEADAPIFDDSALNTLVLFCDDAGQTTLTSTAGHAGNTQPVQNCPTGTFLKSFQLRVSPAGNQTDNTAVNNIRFTCSDGSEINGIGNTGGFWGDYSAECVDGICGMETRVRPEGGLLVDNTALNDVRFTCCAPAYRKRSKFIKP
ncbi:vitelline membrane outer layer protein 1 homolog [Daphnia carinata]|uniref:vitelline membrane outer layer protein 1 homolog n=1 Tax=Daphnia carinata TaxID=120202 RepID=UPI00257F6EF5|nr:vitelline membrane outer layer protein 1 homolog [Daphnia carinata]